MPLEMGARQRLAQARAAVVARAAELAELARRRREIAVELGATPEWALAFLRGRVRQQLAARAQADRLALLPGEAAVLAAAHRVAMLEDDRRRLEAVEQEHLGGPLVAVERARARLEAVLGELRVPSRKLDALHLRDEVESTYGLPLATWRDHRRRYSEQVAHIVDLPRPRAAG